MTCTALGLEEQAVKDYIKQNKPTYPEFEAWVKKNAKSFNRDAIEKHNAAVRGYIHDDETRAASHHPSTPTISRLDFANCATCASAKTATPSG